MFKVEKCQTTINERVFDFADFIVTDLFSLVEEQLRERQANGEYNLEFEEVLADTLLGVEQDWEEQKLEYELNVLEEKAIDVEALSNNDIERIVWGK